MPRDGTTPGSPEDWIRHASSDLSLASQQPAPDVLYEALCFHAQQAAEKSLKAVLAKEAVDVPFTHSIARLITLVRECSNADWPEELDEAAALTQYAVQLRYPGPRVEVTAGDYEEAVDVARRVLEWARSQIE